MTSPADRFRVMAAEIEKNSPQRFGGAVLIVPPQGGEAIELLLNTPKQDIASFWGAVQGQVQVAVTELQEKQNNPFGMQR